MAKTIGFGVVPPAVGPGVVIAMGTVAQIGDAGSFAVQLDSSGSNVLRNVVAAFVTQIGTVAVIPTATGSSSGYVTVNLTRMGTFVLSAPGGTVDLQYVVFAVSGSV